MREKQSKILSSSVAAASPKRCEIEGHWPCTIVASVVKFLLFRISMEYKVAIVRHNNVFTIGAYNDDDIDRNPPLMEQ